MGRQLWQESLLLRPHLHWLHGAAQEWARPWQALLADRHQLAAASSNQSRAVLEKATLMLQQGPPWTEWRPPCDASDA